MAHRLSQKTKEQKTVPLSEDQSTVAFPLFSLSTSNTLQGFHKRPGLRIALIGFIPDVFHGHITH
jgi:hypothetical protein